MILAALFARSAFSRGQRRGLFDRSSTLPFKVTVRFQPLPVNSSASPVWPTSTAPRLREHAALGQEVRVRVLPGELHPAAAVLRGEDRAHLRRFQNPLRRAVAIQIGGPRDGAAARHQDQRASASSSSAPPVTCSVQSRSPATPSAAKTRNSTRRSSVGADADLRLRREELQPLARRLPGDRSGSAIELLRIAISRLPPALRIDGARSAARASSRSARRSGSASPPAGGSRRGGRAARARGPAARRRPRARDWPNRRGARRPARRLRNRSRWAISRCGVAV